MTRNYQDPQYKEWRKKIYARDNHQCQWPGCNSKKKLQAHHIYKWSDFPGLRYHPQNGITVCSLHHKFIKNDEDSYREFFTKLLLSK